MRSVAIICLIHCKYRERARAVLLLIYSACWLWPRDPHGVTLSTLILSHHPSGPAKLFFVTNWPTSHHIPEYKLQEHLLLTFLSLSLPPSLASPGYDPPTPQAAAMVWDLSSSLHVWRCQNSDGCGANEAKLGRRLCIPGTILTRLVTGWLVRQNYGAAADIVYSLPPPASLSQISLYGCRKESVLTGGTSLDRTYI